MTVLALSMPWPLLALILPAALLLFMRLAEPADGLLTADLLQRAESRPVVTVLCWFYAVMATVICLAPAGGYDRLLAVLLSLALFRMALTDALTGFLPRELTAGTLAAGLVAAPVFLPHLLAAAGALAMFAGWRFIAGWRTGREALGLGDVWLAGAVCSWLGWASGMTALLAGVGLFVLWQLSQRRCREGGPMGPWLCAGAMLATLLNLFTPLITITG